MKHICLFLLLSLFQTAILQAEPATPKTKITRDEAQHIALKQMPDASVKSARLEQKTGKAIWAVAIAKHGAKSATDIYVDASTGRILSAAEIPSPAEGPAKPKRP